MARRKRSARQSGDPSRPNTILVILLVLFFLSTAGLGGWVYSMFNDRYKYEEATKKAENEKNRLERDLTFAQGVIHAWRAAMGDKTYQDADTEDYKAYKVFMEDLDNAYAPIEQKEKAEKDANNPVELNKEELQVKKIMELIQQSSTDLPYNKNSYMYEKKYPEVIAALKAELKKVLLDTKGYLPDKIAEENLRRDLENAGKAAFKKMFADIATGNKAAMDKTKEYQVALTAQFNKNAELVKDMDNLSNEFKVKEDKYKAKIKDLNIKLEAQGVAVAEVAAPPALTKKDEVKGGGNINYAGTPHALMLDVSKGKPLWDVPRAKVIRVDEKALRVYLDKGAESGVQLQMTFNVFGAGWDNRAEKMLKGTVEIIRVDAKSSQARITSLYDSEGREIALGDPGTTKILREASNPIKEGDLLFNLAWGSHVAIAGVLDWNGQGNETEAGLVEDLEQFRNLLKSQGVIVDAFVDMRDGKIYGTMTSKTNYLIRGYGFATLDKKAMGAPRIVAINESIGAMRKEALERGLFVISPENFALVIGYRQTASALSTATLDFRPSLPTGGSLVK